MTLVGAAAGAAGGRKAMKEKTITVSHEVSPEYGKCSFGGDFWGEEVCKYHALRTQTHGNKAPPEYRKPKCLLFNCWLEEPYKKCEMCRKACAEVDGSERSNPCSMPFVRRGNYSFRVLSDITRLQSSDERETVQTVHRHRCRSHKFDDSIMRQFLRRILGA